MSPERHFQPCEHCCRISMNGDGSKACPVIDKHPITPEYLDQLQQHTPFSQWYTAARISEQYGYSPRHISRLVSDPLNGVAAIHLERRWFILICSFSRYMDRKKRKKRK